jgi:hypothetical protein
VNQKKPYELQRAFRGGRVCLRIIGEIVRRKKQKPVRAISGEGYFSCWRIKHKQKHIIWEVAVTDDACEVIVYTSVEAAVRGAKDFLSI